MDALYFLKEEDFRRWLREELKEIIKTQTGTITNIEAQNEQVLSRQEVATLFKISTVTLNTWMAKGLPHYRQSRSVFFLRSEIMAYLNIHKKKKDF